MVRVQGLKSGRANQFFAWTGSRRGSGSKVVGLWAR